MPLPLLTPATTAANFCRKVVWPAAENGILVRSLGKTYAGEGHEVGQLVSATTISLPQVLAMLVKVVFKFAKVALDPLLIG